MDNGIGLLKKYFELKYDIQFSKNRLKEIEENFYNQTMSPYVTTTELGLIVRSFDLEHNVCELIDTTAHIRKGIEDNETRLKYFKRFMDELPKEERILLVNKFIKNIPTICQDVEAKALDEIREIETMINLMNGHPEEVRRIEKEEDETEKSHVLKMCEMLGV